MAVRTAVRISTVGGVCSVVSSAGPPEPAIARGSGCSELLWMTSYPRPAMYASAFRNAAVSASRVPGGYPVSVVASTPGNSTSRTWPSLPRAAKRSTSCPAARSPATRDATIVSRPPA